VLGETEAQGAFALLRREHFVEIVKTGGVGFEA